MSWITSNWIWMILIGGMIAMHLRHGGHGGHGGGTSRHSNQSNPPEGTQSTRGTQPPALGDEDASAPTKHRGC